MKLLSCIFLLALGAQLLCSYPSIGGTTGTLSVKVLDATGASVSGAKLSATSPSQAATGVTDAHGFFAFVNLSPDTYTVVASKQGYESTTLTGVTIQADQTFSLDVTMQTTARLLGTVTTSATANVVNKGVTGDLYSVNAQALNQYQGSFGGSETFNSQYGVLASLPGVVRALGTGGGYYGNNLMSIRGGTPDQIGFELEGVPLNRSFDKYNGSSLAMNGLSSIELYTGGEPADAGRSMSGFVNEVIRRGSYPGGGELTGFIGGPAFNHSLLGDVYGGTPDGRFTYFISSLAVNADYRFGNANNLDNSPINVAANDPACPIVNFVNGASLNCTQAHTFNLPIAQAPITVFTTETASIRNTVTNFHYALRHGDMSDDLQLLYSVDSTLSPFPYSGSTIDPLIANATNANNQIVWPSGQLYTGALGHPFNPSAFLTLTWPSAGGGTGVVPAWYYDGQTTQASVEKLSYTHMFSPSSFLRFYVYGSYSAWNFDQATNTIMGGVFYTERNNSTGATATYQNQLNEQHLLRVDLDYEKQVGLRYSYSPQSFSGGNVRCGNLSLGSSSLAKCASGDNVARISPPSHSWNDLPEVDTDIALSDKWHPSNNLLFDLGVRFDRFQIGLTPLVINGATGIAEQSQTQFGQCLDGYAYAASEPCFGYLTALGGSAAPGTANWQDVSGALTFNEISPRFGFTYTFDPADVFRLAIGRYVEAASTGSQEYVGAPFWGVGGTVLQLNNYYHGFGFLAVHNVQPEDSTNYDASFEHRFAAGWSAKISPFYRVTRNQILSAPANPQFPQLSTSFNFGAAHIKGVEFLVARNRTSKDGLNVTLAATYNDAKIQFQRTIGGHSFVDAINGAISAYNMAYGTSFALLDPNGYYSPSVVEAPQFMYPSYDVRWTANLGLDERFQGWDLMPTFNYQSGSPYGDPLGFPDVGVHKLSYGPDPYTNTFDALGSLTGPSWLTMNIGLSHELGTNTKATLFVTNVFTSIHNHGYPWEFPTKSNVLSYGDNNFFFGFPFIGSKYLGENYYPYAPFSVNPTTQYTMAVSVKL
jgi:hypothetical protein